MREGGGEDCPLLCSHPSHLCCDAPDHSPLLVLGHAPASDHPVIEEEDVWERKGEEGGKSKVRKSCGCLRRIVIASGVNEAQENDHSRRS